MSANEDFNILKTAVLKKSDEIPAQRQYAPLAWEFVLGFAHKNLESLTLQNPYVFPYETEHSSAKLAIFVVELCPAQHAN